MKIIIDGTEYEATEGQNLLETCLSLGLDLPYFCWHPAMGSIGACRQCAVVQYQNAEDERGRLVMGCMTPVSDGAIFSLSGDKAQRFRKGVVESLMINHPHDCPVCAEGGECHLQDMTVMVGHRDRRYRGKKNTYRNQYLGPLVHHEMNRCITCYRCTRYYRDYAGGTDLAAQACHDHIFFGRHEPGVLDSEFSGNLVEVCPTGVFTDKTLVHDYTRKWDLQSAPSVCNGCAVGCNTIPGERYGRLKRVHNRFNAEVNGYFLCDRGRYGAGYVNDEKRLEYPGLRDEDGRFNALDHHRALQHFIHSLEDSRVAAVGSPRASVEANFLLRLLAGADNFSLGLGAVQQSLVTEALQLSRNTGAVIPDIATIESADAIFILGEDVTNTAPRIALALRQSVRNKAYQLASELGLQEWQDAAIRNLAQDQRSPLFIASVAGTRLDDVAEQQLSLSPPDITALGMAVAETLRGSHSDTSESGQPATEIAEALNQAKRPLIISGTGCGDIQVMQAAAQIAEALNGAGKRAMLSLVVPEANSLGQALLCEAAPGPSLEQLAERAQQGAIDTLVVMENDLYFRSPTALVDSLLQHCRRVIVLEGMDNATSSAGHLTLPAASFIETEGTVVSLEGRAQRHFPVFHPAGERRPSWVWLLAALKEQGREEVQSWQHFDDVTRGCAAAVPGLSGINAAAPDHLFRNAGVRVPRQPHRYSGRTAMRANISVHEPKQLEDEESALSFSMEGLNRNQPGALLPFVWAPGWNSNQSLHRFQTEAGGPLKGGTAGVRLLNGSTGKALSAEPEPSTSPTTVAGYRLVPLHHIFGSEPLSAISPGISELVPPACIELCRDDATTIGVADGDGVQIGEMEEALLVTINDSVAPGCAGFSAGYRATVNLLAGSIQSLRKAEHFVNPQPTIIGSDRGGQHG